MNLKKKRRVKPSAFLALFLLIFICIFAFAYNGYKNDLKAPVNANETVMVEITQGMSWYQIFDKLEAVGLIRNADSAKIYSKLNDLNDAKAGLYQVPTGMTLENTLAYLQANNAIVDQVMITIPEGYWARQIAEVLGSNLSVTSEELLEAWNDAEYVKTLVDSYEVLTDEIFDEDSKVLLEGYLFPETYSFIVDTDVDEVTRRILDHTEAIYKKYEKDFNTSSYSTHELMTLASIVQFESGRKEDMKYISSVFHNRLNSGMKLQSSVTVCYAIYDYSDWKACEYYAEVDSPYNTYLHEGLPPSPILNPGEAAIEVTLRPADSKYYFFIGDVYGDGKTIFAETYAEHLKNIDKYLK